MKPAELEQRLAALCAESSANGLQQLATELGYREPAKTATNLGLLHELLGDCNLLALIAAAALEAADPDLALNNLERLSGTVNPEQFHLAMLNPDRRRQLLTVLGASQFLTGILCRDKLFFQKLINENDIDRAKSEQDMLAELREKIAIDTGFEELQRLLRRYKCREILRIGARDLCGMAELLEVTGELSSLAAATLQRAYEVCDNALQAEFGTPMVEAHDGSLQPAEFTIFGMGKFGGRELNFSSDIDLIYFYSSEKGETTGVEDASDSRSNVIPVHSFYVKLADLVSKAIGQITSDGFVFRVDLRLRPEGNSGEIAQPAESAILYYESWGQSWERAAMIKARPVAGSIRLGEYILNELEPFIFRRHLDYAMVEDIKGMKQRIDSNLTRLQEGEKNLKLGRGGIREIEFFVQALQLINAGKKSSLRSKSTVEALKLLHAEGLVKDDELPVLTDAYVFLRTVEHRIQVVQEKQTHNLPEKQAELLSLARRCGFPDRESFAEALETHRQGVSAIFRDLFYSSDEEIRDEVRPEVAFLFDPASEAEQVKDLFRSWGLENPDNAYQSLCIIRDGAPHKQLTLKARRHMERIAPLLMQEVIDSPEPDMALTNMEKFLSALRARGTYYALLAENREIIKLLVSLFGTSQFLTRIFIQHPEILDSLVSRSYAQPFKDLPEMEQELAVLLAEASDYERKLEVVRRYRNEEFLRIALNDIHGHTPQGEKTYQLSRLADCCLKAAIDIATEELLPRYGLPFITSETGETRQAGFLIVGMGKLGGMELTYHSDLDIIFIFEGAGETAPAEGTDPDRFRPQINQQYFARLAQRIISVLTLVTQDGYVYQIDTRLRPSGNQGPLVTSRSAFADYHESSAQLWERQALIKARVVAGPDDFAAEMSALIEHHAYEAPLPDNPAEEIARLRQRMENEIAKETEGHFNLKTGRGGMVDVEFLAQYLQLVNGRDQKQFRQTNTLKALQNLNEAGILEENHYVTLRDGYKFLRRLENTLRLIHDQSINEFSGETAYLTKLARRLGYDAHSDQPGNDLLLKYRKVTEDIRTVFNTYLLQD